MWLWDDVFLSNTVSKLSIEFDSNVAIHGLDIHLGFTSGFRCARARACLGWGYGSDRDRKSVLREFMVTSGS